jgi:hypothetical protein
MNSLIQKKKIIGKIATMLHALPSERIANRVAQS